MTIIDARRAEVDEALADWADAIARFSKEVQALNAEVREQFALPLEDVLVRFEELAVGAMVRVAGEWATVVAKVTDALAGTPSHRLILHEEDRPSWVYPVGAGELFTVRAPF